MVQQFAQQTDDVHARSEPTSPRATAGGPPAENGGNGAGRRESTRRLPSHVELFGFASTPARLEVVQRSRLERRVRAVLALLGCWALIPVVGIIPPHIEWAATAFIGGIFLARRYWRAEFVAVSFEGACPRCASPLAMKPGTLVSVPHTITCYECHSEPWLELGDVPRKTVRSAAQPSGPTGAAPVSRPPIP